MNAQHAEALACLKGLEQAAAMGLQRIILETDATVVANGIRENCINRSVLSTLFREIRTNVLYDFVTCSISRFFSTPVKPNFITKATKLQSSCV
jgi:ribonuclease HI